MNMTIYYRVIQFISTVIYFLSTVIRVLYRVIHFLNDFRRRSTKRASNLNPQTALQSSIWPIVPDWDVKQTRFSILF
jgi:hypothetical protein